MTIKNKFPLTKPSLNLDFVNSATIDPRITFSRASAATFYDGHSVAKAEENLLVRSQEFDQVWAPTALTISPNSTTAPDGTTTADTLTPAATNTYFRVTQKPFAVVGPITLSVYVKANGYTKVALREDQTSGAAATFDLATGAAIGVFDAGGVTVSNAAISSVGNSWYRISCTFSGATSVGAGLFVLDPSYTSGAVTSTWTANGTSGIYLWGAQLEQRSQVTDYTPTTSSPVTNYIPALQTVPSNTPRRDHDPVTGECKGLLIEEQRTNLLTYSAIQYSHYNSSVVSNAIAPDGTATANAVFSIASGNIVYASNLYTSFVAGTVYTFSIYVKQVASRYVKVVSNSSAVFGGQVVFDLQTASVASASYGTGYIQYVGNGWYRLSVSGTGTVSGGQSLYAILASDGAGSPRNAASAGELQLYSWGAQLEAGSFPTSYIKTEASQVTRAADSASMTGANFSSWYRQDEGTLFGEASRPVVAGGDKVMVSVSDGTSANTIELYGSNDRSAKLYMANGGSIQALSSVSSIFSDGIASKTSTSYRINDVGFSSRGILGSPDATAIVPLVTNLGIGNRGGGLPWNGHIKRLAYYPKRLTDAQLQALTA